MDTESLQIKGLSKRYDNGVQALDNVSLSIRTGMFGLLGPNGAGKSTLMRTIATLQEADNGSIRLGKIDVLKEKDQVRRSLGYLPQEFGLYPKVSARKMLEHFAVLKGLAEKSERKKVVEGLLRKTNLWDQRNESLGSFSGGMKQRFGIAQALLGNPRLIVVDEPTAGLDPEERIRFHNLLGEIGENIIVILSTHIVEDVSQLCQSMAIIYEGRVCYAGDPLQAIEAIRGRVWQKMITKQELAGQPHELILAKKLFAGKLVVRILADNSPDPSFSPTEPTLEDVYFATIKKQAKAPLG